ncbi:MAG: bifunctional (p)ppGpp synthetase/guanosine-3',5'-bis(diphosphate) 3'-pyrophosphohydrolase [Bacteroidales bacterium]|nr:bifunctional (p)ppGpp synthetase/guanosine-3',5'-bis(diphosphate) 3'-pyrophosphohydrolase [Bacteroidales bacterium]
MEVFTETERKNINEQFEDLLANCPRCKRKEDRELIIKAYKIAYDAHKDMRRASGEPYILHPIAVAKIASNEIGLGVKSIICALLHDIVEDTDYTLKDIENNFGKKIASIIDGLTKISGVFDNKSSLQAENFRKMLLTLSDDVRVILLKLADRLHNMRTLEALPHHKQYKIAGETLYLYAPLAHRLGLNAIKTELEDLSLKYQHPKIYAELEKKIKDSEEKRMQIINRFSLPIIEILSNNNFTFDISGRTKSIYSIWNKMHSKGIAYDEIYDILAIRIIFKPKPRIPEKIQCWNIYSLITDKYTPKPERIRDWVSHPKVNGYEALHVTVMGPYGKWIEVQIRSERMNEIAERGFAAHWKYKGEKSSESELDKWIKTIREHLENPNSDALQFLDDFKLNLFAQEIMVFTPKGQLITLPKDSTTLDFAYEIHSEIGNKAIGAKVNHKLVPLNYKLSSGDQVEIITSDKQKTQHEWLDYVTTAKAKSSINNAFKSEYKDRILRGQKLLEKKLKEMELYPSSSIFKKMFDGYKVANKDELYSKIGSNIITLENIDKILQKKSQSKWIKYWKIQFNRSTTKIEDQNIKTKKLKKKEKSPLIIKDEIDTDNENLKYQIAKCCNPIPGDDVVGFKSQDDLIIIHQNTCSEAIKLMSSHGEDIVSATWTSHRILSFLIRLRVKGIDRDGIYFDLANIISKDLNISIRSIFLDSNNGIFEGTIDLYVHNKDDLIDIISKIETIKGIENVVREEIVEE